MVVPIDEDLARALRDHARTKDVTVPQLVDQLLRRALDPDPVGRAAPFQQKTFSMGVPAFDATRALAESSRLEDAELLRKLSAGK